MTMRLYHPAYCHALSFDASTFHLFIICHKIPSLVTPLQRISTGTLLAQLSSPPMAYVTFTRSNHTKLDRLPGNEIEFRTTFKCWEGTQPFDENYIYVIQMISFDFAANSVIIKSTFKFFTQALKRYYETYFTRFSITPEPKLKKIRYDRVRKHQDAQQQGIFAIMCKQCGKHYGIDCRNKDGRSPIVCRSPIHGCRCKAPK